MIRENNFNHTAKEFIAENKEMARSYIYDYDIYSHSKPPKLELFIAGEALGQDQLSSLYRSAHDFGLTDDQLIITQRAATDQNEMTDRVAIQSIYERSDQEITRGYSISTDSLGRTEEIIIILKAGRTISQENMEKLRKWLTVRLDFENVKLLQQ